MCILNCYVSSDRRDRMSIFIEMDTFGIGTEPFRYANSLGQSALTFFQVNEH